MPVTRSRNGMHEMLSLDQTNTARFLFGEEEGGTTSPDVNNYLDMNATENNFPILVRTRNSDQVRSFISSRLRKTDRHMQLSASSAALDLALSQSPAPESNGWNAFTRHRPTQSQQLPGTIQTQGQVQANGSTSNSQANVNESPISSRSNSFRHSLDLKYTDGQDTGLMSSPKPQATPPKLQSSYSANDVPTMRSSTNGVHGINNTPNSHAQQHLHNHNASLGRIPPSAINNRVSREMTSPEAASIREAQNGGYASIPSISSALHPNAPAFGPSLTQSMSQAPIAAGMTSPTSQQAYPASPYYNNYNMGMMTMGMQNMALSQPMYSPGNPYAGYGGGAMYAQPPPPRDSQARVIQQRRQNDGEGKFFLKIEGKDNPANQSCSYEPICQYGTRDSWWRDLCLVQGSTWLPLLAKEARGSQSGTSPHDLA